MLLVEIGVDIEAFGSADKLASWAGMCPGNNGSAGKRKSGFIRKANAWLRRQICSTEDKGFFKKQKYNYLPKTA